MYRVYSSCAFQVWLDLLGGTILYRVYSSCAFQVWLDLLGGTILWPSELWSFILIMLCGCRMTVIYFHLMAVLCAYL